MFDKDFAYFEEKGLVGYVFLNRTEKLNALDSLMLRNLKTIIESIDCASIRCLVFKSNSKKAFVAGADIKEMSTFTREQALNYSNSGKDVFQLIEDLPIPTISLIEGFALGGGIELALSCDIRIASNNAKIGFPETSLGLLPGFGGTQRLSVKRNRGVNWL